MTIRTILVVDDDLETLKVMRRVLEPLGYVVSVADNGRTALKAVRREAVDLVITDLLMPEGDGLELITALRKNFARIGVIAISGGGQVGPETYLTIARGLGVGLVLHKPVKQAELVTAIKAIEARSDPAPRPLS